MGAYRQVYVDKAKEYVGAVQGSKKHHEIIDIFNTHQPDGYKMSYHEPWCATFVSAMATALGSAYEAIIPRSASCSYIIDKAKKKGIWVEKDAYVPNTGDLILYDWEDDGKGDDTGAPNHIGIVTECDGHSIEVLEGNMSSPGKVGYRKIKVNGRYIRGFVTPEYTEKKMITVKYQVRYSPMKKLGLWRFDGASAGNKKYFIRSIHAFSGAGQLWVRGRRKKTKEYTDWVPEKSWLPNYVYDRIQFKLLGVPEYRIQYRVYVKSHGWLPWVTGYNNKNDNGYAGLDGYGIRKVEVRIV